MIRLIFPAVIATLGALLTAFDGQSAPGPKETDKPLPPATAAQRMKTTNNLKMIGIAMHNHHDTYNFLPANYLTADGKVGLSWRVAILPFIEEDQLLKGFRLNEAWDSEHNKKLIERMPKLYMPVRGNAEKHETFYQMFAGNRTLLGPPGKGVSFANITDGLSNTFMVAESIKPVIWTKPDDMEFDGKTIPKLGGMFDGEFNVVMGDGAVKRFPKGVDANALKLAIDRADGQVVDLDDAIKKAKE